MASPAHLNDRVPSGVHFASQWKPPQPGLFLGRRPRMESVSADTEPRCQRSTGTTGLRSGWLPSASQKVLGDGKRHASGPISGLAKIRGQVMILSISSIDPSVHLNHPNP